jgi:hypothetical protein
MVDTTEKGNVACLNMPKSLRNVLPRNSTLDISAERMTICDEKPYNAMKGVTPVIPPNIHP